MANPVQGIQFTPRIQFKTELQPLGGKKGPSFADALRNALNDVSGLQEESQRAITAFVNGLSKKGENTFSFLPGLHHLLHQSVRALRLFPIPLPRHPPDELLHIPLHHCQVDGRGLD